MTDDCELLEPGEPRNNRRRWQPDTRLAAARRHQRRNEPMCPACATAWQQKNREDYLQRKAQQNDAARKTQEKP